MEGHEWQHLIRVQESILMAVNGKKGSLYGNGIDNCKEKDNRKSTF
jgi:hypothetical protein